MSKTKDDLELHKTQSFGKWQKNPENFAFRLIPDEVVYISDEGVEAGNDAKTSFRVYNASDEAQMLKIQALGPILAWKQGEEPSEYFEIHEFSSQTINLTLNAKMLNASSEKIRDEWTIVLSQYQMDQELTQVTGEGEKRSNKCQMPKISADPWAVVELRVKLVGKGRFQQWQADQKLLVASAEQREKMEKIEMEKREKMEEEERKKAFRLIPNETIYMCEEVARATIRVYNASRELKVLKIQALGPIQAWKKDGETEKPFDDLRIHSSSSKTIDLTLNTKLLNGMSQWKLILGQHSLVMELDEFQEPKEVTEDDPTVTYELCVKLVEKELFEQAQMDQKVLVADAEKKEKMDAEEQERIARFLMKKTERTEEFYERVWRRQEEKAKAKALEGQKAQELQKVNSLGKGKPKTVDSEALVKEVPKVTESSGIQKTQPMPEKKIQKTPDVKPMVMKPVKKGKKGKKKGKRGCCSIQ